MWIVVKLSKTSILNKENWETIQKTVSQHIQDGLRPLLVFSTPKYITKQLQALPALVLKNEYLKPLQDITNIYLALAKELSIQKTAKAFEPLEELQHVLENAATNKSIDICLHARIIACSELALTNLAAAFFQSNKITAESVDAQQLLSDSNDQAQSPIDLNPEALQKLEKSSASVLITQGNIGDSNPDLSAAFFAKKLKAKLCETWSNVPGIYTADPNKIPEARQLLSLDYSEAQEIAATGAYILHPSAIQILKEAHIPLHIKFIQDPQRQGTVISDTATQDGLRIKSIPTKQGIFLVSIESANMWQQVGFLADICQCFKKHKVSIDLVSTSEASVTISVDNETINNSGSVFNDLLNDLNQFANAKLIGPCASISIIGHNIRSILHQLGGVFELFESQQIYLLSQAANDLNLTFVIDENQLDRTTQQLHSLLIDQNPLSRSLSSWQEEFGQAIQHEVTWWEEKREQLLELTKQQSPIYVYDHNTINSAVNQLKSCDAIDKIFYAMKANNHPEILLHLEKSGLNFECVSLSEVEEIFALIPNIDPQRILFTPNFAAYKEYQQGLELGVRLTIDNIYPLQNWAQLFAKKEILLRIDPGHGTGHHKFVVTGGSASKFGIPVADLPQVQTATSEHNISVVGLHIHSGSGIFQVNHWKKNALLLTQLVELFPSVRSLDLGGGLGVTEYPGQKALNLTKLNTTLAQIKTDYPNLEIWIEPGRYIVAKSGVLLAKVTQLKSKAGNNFIGIETGMNSLIRPALYGAHHEIVNLTHLGEPTKTLANIVGPICESADTLGYSRPLPETKEGDVILIANTGAYGHTMSSKYNQRTPAVEKYI